VNYFSIVVQYNNYIRVHNIQISIQPIIHLARDQIICNIIKIIYNKQMFVKISRLKGLRINNNT